jgi:mono/diheme cytochrome c family protein
MSKSAIEQPQAVVTGAARGGNGDGQARRTGRLHGLLAELDNPGVLLEGCRRLRDAGFTRWDAHAPYPVHGLDDAMGIRMTILPVIVFVIGAIGTLTGLALQWWANASQANDFRLVPTFLQGYAFLISGKPYFSLPANIPVIFELTVLFAALAAGIGMLALNNLPLWSNPLFASRRFLRVTTDRFFISVSVRDPRFERAATHRLLAALPGCEHVEEVFELPDSTPPRWVTPALVIAGVASLVPMALIVRAWGSKSGTPRFHIVQDMDNQERFKSQQVNPVFADGRAGRPPVAGAVARGQLFEDDHYYLGGRYVKPVGQAADQTADPSSSGLAWEWFDSFPPPVAVNQALLDRGQQRFNIYCAPCHGLDGDGQGPVRVRSEELETPLNVLSYQDEQVKSRPLGHLFNTITNGIRTMPAYGDQIPVYDRWAIVAYVKALQRAGGATVEDVPPDQRVRLR